jgi:hypothetical protein
MTTTATYGEGNLKSRYALFESTRQPYLTRARECSRYTIPTLIPPEGNSSASKIRTPFQAFGARGVNNLAAKLLLSLLPPNAPFFRLTVDDVMLQKMTGQEGMRSAVEEALGSIERSIMVEIETSTVRTASFEALKHLLVAGNVLGFIAPEGGMKVFRLDRYVLKRDPMGHLLEIITKEDVSAMELPEDFRQQVQAADGKASPEDIKELYTGVKRTAKGWDVWQEIDGHEVPGSRGTYPKDKSPWLALRYTVIDGEDYGRGFVEEYLGDIKSLEGLQKAIVQGSAAASKVLFLVKPNSTTKLSALADSESGDIKSGNADDVTVLQVNKAADFRVALETMQHLQESLSYAFLLNAAIQRSGERVTAEEIRYMANELDTALGGVYSTLSQEYQLPLLTRIMLQMEQKGRLPVLPKGVVKPLITTGMDAIGRGNDLNKLQQMLAALSPLGPEAISQSLNIDDYIKRIGSSLGIDTKGMIYTAEEKAAKAEQAQMMEMVQKLGPQAISAVGGMAKQGMASGAPAPQPPTE